MNNSSTGEKIVILHGTNYWNMGDLGLMVALIQSLLREFGSPQITILSRFSNEERPPGQTFDITSLGVTEQPFLALSTPPPTSRWQRLLLLSLKTISLSLRILACRIGLYRLLSLPISNALRDLCDADIIISKPGGFIHSHMALDHLLQIFLATLTGKPVIIYAQSIGPFSSRGQILAARFVLQRADFVLVRDEPSLKTSLDTLRLSPQKVSMSADEAFLLESDISEIDEAELAGLRPTSDTPLVGMTVLNWHFPDADDAAEAEQRYVRSMIALANHIIDSHHAQLVLFPFTLSREYGRNDEAITQRVVDGVRQHDKVQIIWKTDPRVIKSVQAKLDAFVGSRMHSNIFALGAKVPVLAIAYLPKTTGIMAMVGLSDHVLDINTLDEVQLIEHFDNLWESRHTLHRHLTEVIPKIQAQAATNSKMARSLIQSSRAVQDTVRHSNG